MRFMMLVKHAEDSGPPPKELMDAMAKLSEEAVKAGTLVDSGGLAPTSMRTRVAVCRWQGAAIEEAFTEAKDIVGGYAVFELQSGAVAVEVAVRLCDLATGHR